MSTRAYADSVFIDIVIRKKFANSIEKFEEACVWLCEFENYKATVGTVLYVERRTDPRQNVGKCFDNDF